MDEAYLITEKQISDVDIKIKRVFDFHKKKIETLSKNFFLSYKDEEEKMMKRLEDEEISEEEFKAWRIKTYTQSPSAKKFQKKVAKIMEVAQKEAMNIANKALPEAYAENYNFIHYCLERKAEGYGG